MSAFPLVRTLGEMMHAPYAESDRFPTGGAEEAEDDAAVRYDTRRSSGAAEEFRGSDVHQALRNLRGLCIMLLLAMHSAIPYVVFANPRVRPFSQPPYEWLAFPIVDERRWFGFDLLTAWQDIYLMSLMFFLSGVFTWPSLRGKGGAAFFKGRIRRLGGPFLFGVLVMVPLALYPAYRVTAEDPTPLAYLRAYANLPLLPNGPMWFLWMLLAMTAAPLALHRFAPAGVTLLARISSAAAAKPGRYFVGLVAVAALAYIPMALAFTPWSWSQHGPLSLQLSRPLLYFVYYMAGFGVGAHGVEKGLLAPGSVLARSWRAWFAAAVAALAAWMAFAGLTLNYPDVAPLMLQVLADASYVLAGATSVFFLLAASLRLRKLRSRVWNRISDSAFVIYLLHVAPVIWLQFALLNAPLGAGAKAALAFSGALLATLTASVALERVRRRWRDNARIPPTSRKTPSPPLPASVYQTDTPLRSRYPPGAP